MKLPLCKKAAENNIVKAAIKIKTKNCQEADKTLVQVEQLVRGVPDFFDDDIGIEGRRIATGRQRLLKRGSPMGQQPSLESSHKRRSLRTRKQSKMQSHQDDIEERIGSSHSVVHGLAFSFLENPAASAAQRGSYARGSIWTLRTAIQQMPELAGALIHEVLPSSSARESLKPSEEPAAQSPTEFSNPVSRV
ncbi:hypothetical protein OSTOST_11167, partial [Ostertagia ostertagi]